MSTAYTYGVNTPVYGVHLVFRSTIMTRARSAALIAGLLYFSTHVTSVAAVAAYASGLSDPSAPSAREALLLGVGLEVLLALGVLGTGVALLPLLAPYGPTLAHAFSALRTLEGAVIAAGVLPMLVVIGLYPVDAPVTDVLVGIHSAAFLVGQGLIISVNTLVIGALLVRSGVVPRWIGMLGLAGGALVLVGNVLQLLGALGPDSPWALLFAGPVFAFELSFATCLVVRGLRAGRPVVLAPAVA
jgi:hypothetical protein